MSDDEIDELLATHFFRMFKHDGHWWYKSTGKLRTKDWCPSKDIAQCLRILRRFTDKGWSVELFDLRPYQCILSKDDRRFVGEDPDSAARAACLAVLQTKGLWPG